MKINPAKEMTRKEFDAEQERRDAEFAAKRKEHREKERAKHDAWMQRRKKLADSVMDEPFTDEDRRVMGEPVDDRDRVVYLALRKAGMGMTDEEIAGMSGPPRGPGRPQRIPAFNRAASERALEECRRAKSRLAHLLLRAVMKGKDETGMKRAAYRAARDGGNVRAVVGGKLWLMLTPDLRRVMDCLPDSEIAQAFGIHERTLRRWRGKRIRRRADPTKARKSKDPGVLPAPDEEEG